MTSTTAMASYYGLRLDAPEAFVQGYADGMRLDAKGRGIPCGKGWIAPGKTCKVGKKGGAAKSQYSENKGSILSQKKRKTTVNPDELRRQLSPQAKGASVGPIKGADMVDIEGAKQKNRGASSRMPLSRGRATQVNAEEVKRRTSRKALIIRG